MNWLLLIHQIPAKPTYFRAKIWRRLQRVGAVAIKQAVYVMPDSEEAYEDLSWIAKEIIESNGEAVLLRADLLEGLVDGQVIDLFQSARRADYEKILKEATEVMSVYHAQEESALVLNEGGASLDKLKKSFAEASAIDFFPVAEQSQLEALLADMETILRRPSISNCQVQGVAVDELKGSTWITKRNVYVDRMASGWFIRRFIDSGARFKFIDSTHYHPREGELRFDMLEAEYTHQGDLCTFEVMVQTFAGDNVALQQLAKVIHDIDLKDDAYGLAETSGIHALLDAIVGSVSDDLQRIEQAGGILDGMLVFFEGKSK
jgi:hypothetical protein